MSNLTVILPAYNEEESLGKVIDEIRSLPVKCDILVVDNGSTDETYNIATYKEVKVVTEPNKGKGNAMRTGIKLIKTPYLVMMDSDYTYPAVNIEDVLMRLDGLEFDVVIGERKEKDQYSMSFINSLGNKFLSYLASLLYGKWTSDVCTGMWGFRKTALDKFDLVSEGFTLEADFFINSVRNNCLIDLLPINYRARQEGDKAKLRIWDGFKIAWFLIKRRLK